MKLHLYRNGLDEENVRTYCGRVSTWRIARHSRKEATCATCLRASATYWCDVCNMPRVAWDEYELCCCGFHNQINATSK